MGEQATMARTPLPQPPAAARRSYASEGSRGLSPHVIRACLIAACFCLVLAGFEVFARLAPIVVFVGCLAGFRIARRRGGNAVTHGSARIASWFDLVRAKMLGDQGLILGYSNLVERPTLRQAIASLISPRMDSATACRTVLALLPNWRRKSFRFVRIQSFVHLLTCAPAGRGKSVFALVPNLRSYSSSCVVVDPKSELFGLTGEHRRKKFGQTIFRLDPFALGGSGGHGFNPLEFIDDQADDFLDQCRDLANLMVFRSGEEREPYWNDAAESVLSVFIAFICACETNRTHRHLGMVRELLSSREHYIQARETMKRTPSHRGVIQRLGQSLSWLEDRELNSVLSNVQRHTQWLDSPAVAEHLSRSEFDPRHLRSGKATCYLILPQDRLVTMAPLMRIWVGVTLRVLTRGVPDDRNRVLFLIDEAAHLGKMQILEDAVTIMRGYGIRLWFFFQSLSQLETTFGPKYKTILENCETQQYFGINSYFTADEVSKRIGDATIPAISRNVSDSRSHATPETPHPSGNVTRSRATNVAEMGRRLYRPEELMVLPENLSIVFHRNLPVLPVQLVPYYQATEFQDGGTGRQDDFRESRAFAALAVLLVCGFLGSLAVGLPRADPTSGPVRVYRPRAVARPSYVWSPRPPQSPFRPPDFRRYSVSPWRRGSRRPTQPEFRVRLEQLPGRELYSGAEPWMTATIALPITPPPLRAGLGLVHWLYSMEP
jgi:type IV secretion system protein VirD4